jgi:hypothetical protein
MSFKRQDTINIEICYEVNNKTRVNKYVYLGFVIPYADGREVQYI